MPVNLTRGGPLLTATCLHRIRIALADAPHTCPVLKGQQSALATERAPQVPCRCDALVSALLPAQQGREQLNPGEQQAAATYAQGVAMGLCVSYLPQCNEALRAVEGSAWDDAQLCALRQLGVGHGVAVSSAVVGCPGTLSPASRLNGVRPPSPSARLRQGEQ